MTGDGAVRRVPGVEPRGGPHCETTALGCCCDTGGSDLSEPPLFGLGAGLSFVYRDAKYLDFPFLGGRVRPFELTRNLAARMGLAPVVRETTSPRRAWQNVAGPIDAGHPVGLRLDSHHLEYFGSRAHFGGHVVALYGYDDRDAFLVVAAPAQQVGPGGRQQVVAGERARSGQRGPAPPRSRPAASGSGPAPPAEPARPPRRAAPAAARHGAAPTPGARPPRARPAATRSAAGPI
ncbi:hypothetical protein EBN88_02800 [Streptomyces triticirhizae]|uniref:Butirosin biosynthesis protein H N-terminal domain-containing protein n=1 Tax=Streptomyces triticirhizae TaxID=2483353 RepID=A0A3M2M7U3_9ACTN|nr:hypothetical protein EBN88_02800 [Streptomyces triticirhizae]